MIIFLLLGTIVVLCLTHILLNLNERARLIRNIPGPAEIFILGNALRIPTSPVELFKLGRTYARSYSGIYRFWTYPLSIVNIYNPDDIEKILSTTRHNEKSGIYKFMKPWLREGLLVSSGTKWQERRKVLTPAFHFNILRHFSDVLEENSHRLADGLAAKGQEFTEDIIPLLSEYTLNSICETAMGTRLDEETSGAGRSYKIAIYKLGKILVERFTKPYLYSDFVFSLTSIGKKQKQFLDTIHNFTKKVIKDRKEYVERYGISHYDETAKDDDDVYLFSKKHKLAMLDLLISAEKDGLIDNVGLQEEVDTFMFEGHDTTASGLVYCIALLAKHTDVQEKVVEEIKDIFGSSTRHATIEDLMRMKYLDSCIKESLRLYPPVPFISRNLMEKVQLSNYTVPADTYCHIHIFDLHRREDLFKDPLVFDPDRFLPENSVGRHPYSYIPFSAGPRNCIGQRFAMLEMKSAISTILRKFELRPVTPLSDVEFSADLVLRNTHPIHVSFVKRVEN